MAKAIFFSAVAGDGQRDKVWARCATVQRVAKSITRRHRRI